jgi:hypothetical protein
MLSALFPGKVAGEGGVLWGVRISHPRHVFDSTAASL